MAFQSNSKTNITQSLDPVLPMEPERIPTSTIHVEQSDNKEANQTVVAVDQTIIHESIEQIMILAQKVGSEKDKQRWMDILTKKQEL